MREVRVDPFSRLMAAICIVFALGAGTARADEVRLGLLSMAPPADRFQAFVDGPPPQDEGRAGLELAIADNNSSGRFLGQSYGMKAVTVPAGGDALAAFEALVAEGYQFVIADLPASALTALTASPRAAGVTIFNAGSEDDRLRNEWCHPNLLHTLPSRAMRADALAQFLVRKNWKKWVLVTGGTAEDEAQAGALRRAAARFGAKVVSEKPWTFSHDARRTAEREIGIFTQNLSYDVLVVADESGAFGDLFPYNTWDPRPIAGSQGLVATLWHPAHEQWGAIQLQNRFRTKTGRAMSPKDHAVWQAGRAIGEAALRAGSADPARITATLRSETFTFAAFKGRGIGFRRWDGQLRQPILLAWARAIVSLAPQEGFLHPTNDLDTLGHDKGESRCSAK